MNFMIIIVFVLIILVVFLFKAMKSRYSVEIDFKNILCNFHLRIKPDDMHTEYLDEVSTSREDNSIK